MQLTNEQKDQMVEIMKQIHEWDGDRNNHPPLYQEQVKKMKEIHKELSAHIQQMSAIIEANPVTLTLFEFALTLNMRSANDEDVCLITGEKTQVKKGLLSMFNHISNKEYQVTIGEDDE